MKSEWYNREFSYVGRESMSQSLGHRRNPVRLRRIVFLVLLSLLVIAPIGGQSPNGTISGLVVDSSGAVIVGAEILIANDATGLQYPGKTNGEGFYLVPNLPPGTYRLQVSRVGFKTLIKPDITLNVQDALAINFTLPIGAASEIVTVQGGAPLVNTENAAVSTVVDRQFAENLPMNGRSFQTLIQLTPGVVLTATNVQDQGQFSVNGQRAVSNYWMVDGVSANIGVGVGAQGNNANGLGGALGSFSALGGTNSLVSVDAMQEFRIQTSTYAPEFGRTPGAQISILTRSGTNQFHGTLFDYLRNDLFDANNWFADDAGLPKPRERQNDFGGTFSGPIIKDRTFFFFSYEGLRLRLPQVAIGLVPDANARLAAAPQLQAFFNAFPQQDPNLPDNLATGIAHFNASFSNSATLDAYSLRMDHKLSDRLTLFGRYNYSPSEILERGPTALSVVTPLQITVQTGTVGGTWSISPHILDDLRFNYSRTNAFSYSFIDNFHGAEPLTSLPFPSPFNAQNANFTFFVLGGLPSLNVGRNSRNIQRQINVIDSLSMQRGSHSIKLGVDFRRLTPQTTPAQYRQFVLFSSVPNAEAGNALGGSVFSFTGATFLFRNLSAFAQDTWHVFRRLTLTYGLRWDVDFTPSTLGGPAIPAVTGFDLNDFSKLAIAPGGTPVFNTRYGNLAPRVGVAYQVRQGQNWQTVLRGGFGVFYDLANSMTGGLVGANPPFAKSNAISAPLTFPFSSANSAPPIIPSNGSIAQVSALDPNLKLPYSLEWNVAFEQELGTQQSLSASYIGSVGRRLLQTASIASPPSNPVVSGSFTDNSATSDYDALQVQFQRRLSHGLQLLASYAWAHSIDTGSAGSTQVASNEGVPGVSNRGPSDFDIRDAFSAGMTYDIPMPRRRRWRGITRVRA